MITFDDLGLSSRMMRAIHAVGYTHPTPIQAEFIPLAITGQDCIGQARTGTGKTAAFVIPILETIDHSLPDVQAIVLSPTRELSEQVAAEATKLAAEHNCQPALLVGGRSIGAQLKMLERCPSIVVGTPGRVIDLIQRGALNLAKIRVVVLDEADRMLDIGFRPDIERILRKCPGERQTMLLSATMDGDVQRLAQKYMKSPGMVDLSGGEIGPSLVEQFFCTVDENRKFSLLVRLLYEERPQQAIVFCRTKRGADKLHMRLGKRLKRNVEAIHGDLPQRERDRVFRQLRDGSLRLLIATDVVGRGIDVSGISHIINYDLPQSSDDYVHRVGRTGRISSDSNGRAFTFVTSEEGDELTQIEIRINQLLPEMTYEGLETVSNRRPSRKVDKAAEAPVVSFAVSDDWPDIETL